MATKSKSRPGAKRGRSGARSGTAAKAGKPARRAKVKPAVKNPQMLVKVRNSKVHGRGMFALRRIAKGTRLFEYVGERMSHARVNRRYEDHDENDNHTFLFSVDRNVVIDATNAGNDSRYINHGCDPNCESTIEDRRVFIDVIRTIQPGEELCYDYQIGREKDDPENVDEIYACRCGSPKCRGTMLWPARRPVPRASRATKKKTAAAAAKRKRAA